ncbi:MAG: DUF4375 domain-containing protein [Verrucomicrobia bacterium]|nr:MAG: DUF4375 domain-containing protein [Verrucomicrobiota bacterium]
MKIRKLAKTKVAAAPYEVWNAFIGLLANERYDDLAPEQRPAHLVFRYESEVQNGGHLQYFENRRGDHLDETIAALGILGATEQQEILRQAAVLWRRQLRPRIQTVEDFCDAALDGEYSDLDSRFYACSSSIHDYLQSHLDRHQSNYVLVE